jgi:hypothetical protein
MEQLERWPVSAPDGSTLRYRKFRNVHWDEWQDKAQTLRDELQKAFTRVVIIEQPPIAFVDGV